MIHFENESKPIDNESSRSFKQNQISDECLSFWLLSKYSESKQPSTNLQNLLAIKTGNDDDDKETQDLLMNLLQEKDIQSFFLQESEQKRQLPKIMPVIERCNHNMITKQIVPLFESIAKNCASPFELEVRPSNIANSGNGVFLKHCPQKIQPGAVLALYKGTVYFPNELLLVYSQVFPNNEYLLNRFDESLIDGCNQGFSKNIYEMNVQKIKVSKQIPTNEKLAQKPNPFAVAQLINHSKKRQNVVLQAYEFLKADFPPEMWNFIPNLYFTTNSSQQKEVIVPTMVAIATMEIEEGDELFFDYRFSKNKAPQWYLNEE